ncbi:biotin-dependent carboxyltransferase family protein [Marilutibacter aestuarii]|uniref:Biotin-dependent carboxyltransferase family protein n=1 Tax=Marilutibacter aestuarii TaxID=1706195 RepID=A0A508ARA3_9GAMM|nr:biotin-dependent carboxyltransferase family protein [Lysobacter aestuarii]TQD51021.1 biotin-dependent carboxyltransferase family protein [Lysobacter aestuarii]
MSARGVATVEVLAAGPLTTVQDRGRTGWRHVGVACAGALDVDAAALANRLVGNPPGSAVLEFTLSGPRLRFARPTRVAVCGALVDAVFIEAGGRRSAVGHGRPVELPPGELRIGRLRLGVRGWLAIAGGIDVPECLGSRSTDLRGGFGGLDGRRLETGDRLPLGAVQVDRVRRPRAPAWWVEFDDPLPAEPCIRYVPDARPGGPSLDGSGWQLDPRSNRQGLRLKGDALAGPGVEAVSAAVAPGTIQLPPDGQPIVLMADAQVTGGYPRLGHVAAVDMPRLAQVAPGQWLQWRAIDAAESQRLWMLRRAQWRRLSHLLDERLPPYAVRATEFDLP